MTIPSRQEAQKLFADIAAKLDVCDLQQGKEPQTSRIHFQNVASCAYKIATKISHLDEEKAYILGLLHDYGQLEETLDKNKFHGTAGYDLMMQKGYDEVAKICLTHSFPEYDFKPERFTYNQKEVIRARKIINNLTYDDYDLLIQYSDMLSCGKKITDLKSRIKYILKTYHTTRTDAKIRYKTMLKIKHHFDTLCGKDTYKLLGITND